MVGAIGYGVMGFARPCGRTEERATDDTPEALIGRVLDLGATLIDSADQYGSGEEVISRAVARCRGQVGAGHRVRHRPG